VTIRENEFGYEALRLMTLNNTLFLVVVDKNGAPTGYISRGDLIRAQKDNVADDRIVEEGSWHSPFH
jgi:CBS domain-containing protein